jgi:hypothetical protein
MRRGVQWIPSRLFTVSKLEYFVFYCRMPSPLENPPPVEEDFDTKVVGGQLLYVKEVSFNGS